MPQMLILVHGMGTNPKGWSDEPGGPKAKLNEVAKRYAAFKTGAAFSDQLMVREIAYDHCFSELVDEWKAASAAFDKWTQDNGSSLPTVVNWLNKTLPSNEESAKNFFWSTAIDPLLYRGFNLMRDRVRVNVMTALVDLLKEANKVSAEVTIVAHSLGTAVMHDALHLLGTGRLPPEVKDVEVLLPNRFRFANIFMIADVCLLGPPFVHDIDYFESVVRPVMPDGSAEGYCRRFFGVWHRFDPFVAAGLFRPTTWGNGFRAVGPLTHFRKANVHSFTHYLDHPAVHIPLINASLGMEAIGAQEGANALGNYADIVSPECSQQIERLKAKVKDFESGTDSLEDLAIKIAEFYALARDAKSKCSGIADDTEEA